MKRSRTSASPWSTRSCGRGRLPCNSLGLPMLWAGNFADVYKVHCPATGNTWALKCFTREVRGLQERYRTISAHLDQARLPFTVDFQYLEQGIRVGGQAFPALKMRWVEGQTLTQFVEEHLERPRNLKMLLDLWVRLAARLREARVAHADLQHGNVLLVPVSGNSLALRLLKNAAKVKFHVGTSEVPAAVYLLEGDRAAAGSECLIQVRLDRPVVAGPGDRFILRMQSPPLTVGGGTIIEATPAGRLKRNRPEIRDDLAARADAICTDSAFVEYALRVAPLLSATETDLAHRAKVLPQRLGEIVKELLGDGRAIRLPGGTLIHRDRAAEAESRLMAALAEFHRASPESLGMELDALVATAPLAKTVCEGLLAHLQEAGKIVERSGRFALAAHRPAVADEDQRAIERVEQLFKQRAFAPPEADEVAAAAEVTPDRAAKAVRMLMEERRIVEVAPGMLFHADAIARVREIITDFIKKEGRLESVKFKYLLDTTRRFAIPLLRLLRPRGRDAGGGPHAVLASAACVGRNSDMSIVRGARPG